MATTTKNAIPAKARAELREDSMTIKKVHTMKLNDQDLLNKKVSTAHISSVLTLILISPIGRRAEIPGRQGAATAEQALHGARFEMQEA